MAVNAETTAAAEPPAGPAAAAPARAVAHGDERPLPPSIKAGWATGAFGVAILMNGISALALFYFVSVLRMDPAVAGLLIFASKLYDAVSDPVTGYLSDRTDSAQGRRRPYLFWGAFVSAASFLMVFAIPFQGPWPDATSGPALLAAGYVLF